MQENKEKIRAFLGQYFRDQAWQDDEDFFAGSQVNSLLAMQLVLFLEDEFAIQLDNEDLVLDNFRTVNNLASLVARKQDAAAA